MMSATEYSLTVPVDLVKKTKGLAIDIGGSVVKIAYRSKENLEEAESNTTGVEGHLQLVSFPRIKLTEAVEYIQQRATITRNGTDEPPEIFATGIGCTQLGETLSGTLHIRLNSVWELDCFVKAFTYLASQLSREDFLEPHDLEVVRKAEAEMMEEMVLYAKLQEPGLTEGFSEPRFNISDSQQQTRDEKYSPGDPLAKCEDIYPCILAMCGSTIAYMQINADKSFKVVDVSFRGGTALHGLGTLLTGCKNFEELLELASRGDPSKVHIGSKDMSTDVCAADVDESALVYTTVSEIKHSSLIYSFGKAVGAKREEFRPEDLAMAWLNYFVLELVQCLTLIAQGHGIRRIFVSGSLCNSTFVRRILTKEMTKRIMFLNLFDCSKKVGGTQFNFLKPGPHLGALGALITQVEKLTDDSNTTHFMKA